MAKATAVLFDVILPVECDHKMVRTIQLSPLVLSQPILANFVSIVHICPDSSSKISIGMQYKLDWHRRIYVSYSIEWQTKKRIVNICIVSFLTC